MSLIEQTRKSLIEKLNSINNIELLQALNELISSESTSSEILKLNQTQKELIELSDQDIKNGNTIDQEVMMDRNLKWLKEK